MVGLDLLGWSHVGLVRGMQQVRRLCGSVLATSVTPVSLWPLVTGSNLGA
jgi:hypothetical protein